MYKKLLVAALIIFSCVSAFAQQIPIGECGIVYIYDANGARIKRVYFCNNGTDPYPVARASNASFISNSKIKKEEIIGNNTTASFEKIDAIFPNPTSGKFAITFSKELFNATIAIVDVNGKTVQQSKQSGNRLNFDIYNLPAGIYFVKVLDGNNVIRKKIIKE